MLFRSKKNLLFMLWDSQWVDWSNHVDITTDGRLLTYRGESNRKFEYKLGDFINYRLVRDEQGKIEALDLMYDSEKWETIRLFAFKPEKLDQMRQMLRGHFGLKPIDDRIDVETVFEKRAKLYCQGCCVAPVLIFLALLIASIIRAWLSGL